MELLLALYANLEWNVLQMVTMCTWVKVYLQL